jgi:hypothetical protein
MYIYLVYTGFPWDGSNASNANLLDMRGSGMAHLTKQVLNHFIYLFIYYYYYFIVISDLLLLLPPNRPRMVRAGLRMGRLVWAASPLQIRSE